MRASQHKAEDGQDQPRDQLCDGHGDEGRDGGRDGGTVMKADCKFVLLLCR